MNHERVAHRTSNRRRYRNPDQKDYATFLKTSEETSGALTLIEIEVASGGGTPPHYRKTYDEHFEVLEGTLEVLLGKEKHTLPPGQKAVDPKKHAALLQEPDSRADHFSPRDAPGSAGVREGADGQLLHGLRRTQPLVSPLPVGGVLE